MKKSKQKQPKLKQDLNLEAPKTKIPLLTKASLKLRELKWIIADKFNLSQRFRIGIAITLTVVLIGGLVYFANGGFKKK